MTYKVQIDEVIRDATPDESAAIDAARALAAAQQKTKADALAARKSALAKLEALGLSAAEIQALVGE